MSFAKSLTAIAAAGTILSASAAFGQAGGPDTPTDAKAQGTTENGPSSTGMSKGDAMKTKAKHHHSKKKHHM